VLSVLLTVDYAVIKGVFGAIGEIASKAKATAQQIVAGLVTLGGIVLTGGLALFGQDPARSPDAEVIRDAVGIVTLFGQCMLRCKAGLQNLYNSITDLLERNGL